jgi:diacylglycerol kinase family enzyme
MLSSFAYVFDERLAERKYEREASLLEAELARNSINGHIARLTMFRKPKETIEDLVREGAKHIVFVGDDSTLLRMMWFLPDLDATIGFIHLLGGESKLAPLLGIKQGLEGVSVLASRLTTEVDVGTVGDRYFLSDVIIPDTRAELDVEGRFRLRPTEGGTIIVANLVEQSSRDGLLDVAVRVPAPPVRFPWQRPQPSPETRLQMMQGSIRSNEPVTLTVDGQALQGTNFGIGIKPKKMRVLVGKGRKV